jgi:hypothetical protein
MSNFLFLCQYVYMDGLSTRIRITKKLLHILSLFCIASGIFNGTRAKERVVTLDGSSGLFLFFSMYTRSLYATNEIIISRVMDCMDWRHWFGLSLIVADV